MHLDPLSVLQLILEILLARVLLLGGLLGNLMSAYLAVVQAHILGWTLYMNSRELGWT